MKFSFIALGMLCCIICPQLYSSQAVVQTNHKQKFTKNQSQSDKDLLDALAWGEKAVEKVIEALNNGADCNAQDAEGNSALMLAVDNDRDDIVRLLAMQPKITIDLAALDGETPLSCAIHKGVCIRSVNNKPFDNTTLIKFLITFGANPYHKNNRGESAIDIAQSRPDKPHVLRAINAAIEEYEELQKERMNANSSIPGGPTTTNAL